MDKLQELTDRLYNEGLSKGKEEGEALLAKARQTAGLIVEDAKKEAAEITAKARKDAEDLRHKAESDVRMASEQAIQATRKDIENLVIAKASSDAVKTALSDTDFVKGIITEVAKKFSATEPADLQVILPEAMKGQLEDFVKSQLSQTLGKPVEASFTKKAAGGFAIGPKDGSYFISLTDESFRTLIGEYLRPATRKLLFG